MNVVKFKIIETRDNIVKIRPDVRTLFADVFNRTFSDVEFNHLYLNCPYGTASVFTGMDNEKLIASVAIIPQILIDGNGEKISYYLQSGMMIAKTHRNLQVFSNLMQEVHHFIKDRDTFVIAFPNDKSFLPMTKILGWKHVYDYSIQQLCHIENRDTEIPAQAFRQYYFDLPSTDDFLSWRGEINNMKILENENYKIIYKDYQGAMEVLSVIYGEQIPLANIGLDLSFKKFNIPSSYLSNFNLSNLSNSFESVGNLQRFCVYPKEHKIKYEEIHPSMLLSDVF